EAPEAPAVAPPAPATPVAPAAPPRPDAPAPEPPPEPGVDADPPLRHAPAATSSHAKPTRARRGAWLNPAIEAMLTCRDGFFARRIGADRRDAGGPRVRARRPDRLVVDQSRLLRAGCG